jgi:hypothetical protein
VDAFEKFKWNLLADSFEFSLLVPTPLWELLGDEAGKGKSKAEREALAARVLRELYAEGLIYFFRGRYGQRDPVTLVTPVDKSEHLTPDEVEAMLRDSWWRGPGLFPDIQFEITEVGEAAIKTLQSRCARAGATGTEHAMQADEPRQAPERPGVPHRPRTGPTNWTTTEPTKSSAEQRRGAPPRALLCLN